MTFPKQFRCFLYYEPDFGLQRLARLQVSG